jgi:thioredoxin-related protein
MKSTIFAIATLLFFSAAAPLAANAQELKQLNPGDDLPAIETTLRNANGKSTTLKGAEKENGLLVMFSCNTCPFVIRNQGMTKQTIKYALTHNVGMIIINSNEAKRSDDDSYEAMVKYARSQGYAVPYVVDENSKLADLFGANHTPEIFLFNNKHKLVYKGAMNDNPGDPSSYKKMFIENAINDMIAGKQPEPAVTKSIGCSIKRKA